MKYLKLLSALLAAVLALTAVICGGFYFYLKDHDGGFCRETSPAEQQLRLELVQTAK